MFFSLSTVAMLAATAASMPFHPTPVQVRGESPVNVTTTGSNYTTGAASNTSDHEAGAKHSKGPIWLNPPTIAKRWTCNTSPVSTTADNDDGGAGITLTNGDTAKRGYFVYHNDCDTVPYKYLWLDAGETGFVSLPSAFQGRITRGTEECNLQGSAAWLGTWLEIGLDADGTGWADVSLIRGYDGAVTIDTADGTGASTGFSDDIMSGAPSGASATKSDGTKALMASENLDGSINTVVRDYYISAVGPTNAYVDDYHGNPVIKSTCGRFDVCFHAGSV